MPSAKRRLLCELLAVVEITSESDPADIPVTCQETVALVPASKLPGLTVSELTEKCPLCELNVAETLLKTSFKVAPTTSFCNVALTVVTSPTLIVVGADVSVMLNVWL